MQRGGLETFIMNVYRNIDRKKVQFDFLVHTYKECAYDQEIKNLGGKIYSVPARSEGIIKNYKAINDFFKNHPEYIVVHQHVSSLTYIEPLRAAKRNNVPICIIHSHNTRQSGNKIHKYLHYWNKLLIRTLATHYFACSDFAARWLFGKRQYNKGEFTIINNGIEFNRFKFNHQTREEYRLKLKIENKFVIGHVGRFTYQKNHYFLVDIFKACIEKKPDSVLILVGDGELRNNVEKKCDSLGLKEKVIFTGVRSDISNLVQAMDVFIFPSYFEGLPVALVEAQAAGLICFASDSITKQVNIGDLINYISLDFSADYWAEQIIKVVGNYRRSNITHHIEDNDFDINLVAEKLMEYYINITKGQCH
jgi:glycosyltransferase involved in cell wall biosynthesis